MRVKPLVLFLLIALVGLFAFQAAATEYAGFAAPLLLEEVRVRWGDTEVERIAEWLETPGDHDRSYVFLPVDYLEGGQVDTAGTADRKIWLIYSQGNQGHLAFSTRELNARLLPSEIKQLWEISGESSRAFSDVRILDGQGLEGLSRLTWFNRGCYCSFELSRTLHRFGGNLVQGSNYESVLDASSEEWIVFSAGLNAAGNQAFLGRLFKEGSYPTVHVLYSSDRRVMREVLSTLNLEKLPITIELELEVRPSLLDLSAFARDIRVEAFLDDISGSLRMSLDERHLTFAGENHRLTLCGFMPRRVLTAKGIVITLASYSEYTFLRDGKGTNAIEVSFPEVRHQTSLLDLNHVIPLRVVRKDFLRSEQTDPTSTIRWQMSTDFSNSPKEMTERISQLSEEWPEQSRDWLRASESLLRSVDDRSGRGIYGGSAGEQMALARNLDYVNLQVEALAARWSGESVSFDLLLKCPRPTGFVKNRFERQWKWRCEYLHDAIEFMLISNDQYNDTEILEFEADSIYDLVDIEVVMLKHTFHGQGMESVRMLWPGSGVLSEWPECRSAP